MKFQDELEHDHRAIEEVIELLAKTVRDANDATAFAFGAWALDFFRKFADACHHAKEEQALFPLLEQRGIPKRGGPIGMMLLEHAESRQLLAELDAALVAGDRPRVDAAAGAYCALLRAHISKERGVLFPMGAHRLRAGDDDELVQRFAAIERGAGGGELHARLHGELARWTARLC
ncbi:MAG TPA: hemerythrin domain-containing protein [Myxococcota bacterium]|nr:hemerythrin domain-containing protein [Myxococcota bacterium]